MKNTIMIKKKYEFKNLFSKGKFYYGEFIHMYIRPNSKTYNKLGIAVSKKQGKAVVRNHIKRLIRENYKNFENNLKYGYNILFIINKNKNNETKNINFYDIENDMRKIFEKSGIINEKSIN